MFSDDNVFEDNTLRERRRRHRAHVLEAHRRSGATGSCATAASPRSGLLLKDCDDVVAEDNLIADNARGIFLEGSYRNTLRGNVVAESDIALVHLRLEPRQPLRGQPVRRQPDAAVAVGPAHRHPRRRQLLVRQPRARSRRRRRQRSPVPPVERVRSPARQPDGGRPVRPRRRPPPRSAPPKQAFPVLAPVPVVDAHPLARPPRSDATCPWSRPPPRGMPAPPDWPLALLVAGAVILASRRTVVGPAPRGRHDRLPRLHQALRRPHRRSTA